MRLVIDPLSRSPIYRQIQDQIRYAIAVGSLVEGDALPSIRALESELGVNRNTIRRAYTELGAEGALVIRQGREALVAAQRGPAIPLDRDPASASHLAIRVLELAAREGVDPLELARLLQDAARRHDIAHPRCAIVECSDQQAAAFAAVAERVFERSVIGVNLRTLRTPGAELPSSIDCVFTPRWHLAEVRTLLETPDRVVHAIQVGVTGDVITALRAERGRELLLVVRDAESVSGYRELVRSHVDQAANVTALAAADVTNEATSAAECVIYTTPCHDIVTRLIGQAAHAPRAIELAFEPDCAELSALRESLFPRHPVRETESV